MAIMTRLDISYSLNFFSQLNNCFDETLWDSLKKLLKYLKKTKYYCLIFKSSSKCLEGFVDADWGSNVCGRRSYTGFCFTFSNPLIAWEGKKQKTVALSSTEAEYMALGEAS